MRIKNVVPFVIRGPRAALIALFLLSLAPPILYFHAVVPVLHLARISADMPEGPYKLLRIFGTLSLVVTVLLGLAVGIAYWKPETSQPLFTRFTIFVLLFDAFYLCLTLFLIAALLSPQPT